jgi:hypothetical protein
LQGVFRRYSCLVTNSFFGFTSAEIPSLSHAFVLIFSSFSNQSIMPTTRTTATLAELEAAQQSRSIMAFEMGSAARRLARLQAVYTTKCAQLEAFSLLFEETTPDFVLRSANGPELVLRLPIGDTGCVMTSLRDALESALRSLEAEIISAHLDAEQEAFHAAKERNDLRPAILALCVPSAASTTTPVAVAPASLPVLPAGQRLFATPATRPSAASAV